MRVIFELVRKELIQFRRDRMMLVIIFVSPVMQLVILGFAANLDLRQFPLAVYDSDRSVASRRLGESLFHDDHFAAAPAPTRDADIERLIESGTAQAVLLIPRGFERSLVRGEAARLLLVIDGSEATSSAVATRHIARITAAFGRRYGSIHAAPEMLQVNTRIWFNPTLQSRNFMVPGILALVLMIITTMLTSLAIVKEKESGTLEQLIVSPLSSRSIIVGKLLPFGAIGMIDMLIVLAVALLVFRIPLRGSIALLIGFSAVFVLTTLGLGLFISTVAATQQQAMMTASFFVMMPMMFLSGFIFPIENMPRIVRAITYLMPLRYYFVIVRGIFLRGVGLAVLWPQALALFLLAAAVTMVSVTRFRRRL